MKAKSLVLLSGGLDSTVNLFEASEKTDVKLALTFDYGQRAHQKEIVASARLAAARGIAHKVVNLPFFKDLGQSSLIDTSKEVPQGEDVDILSLATSQSTAKSVWIPNRNGIFLNIAAGFAESLGLDLVIPGFNLEEAKTFPDNSEEYMGVLTQSFFYSTSNKVMVQCYTVKMDKIEIVRRGRELGVPFHLMWPCYMGETRWCGECESCLRAKRAFIGGGVDLAGLPFALTGEA